MGLNSDAFQNSPQKSLEPDHSSPEPVQRSPDSVWRLPSPVDMSPIMERRTSDQNIVTGRTVDQSVAPDKTVTIGLSGRDATGSSRHPITHVYKSAGRGKRKFQNITQRNNEIKGVIIRELGLSPDMIRRSLGHVDVSKKASSNRY
jgi:hypothetical protein